MTLGEKEPMNEQGICKWCNQIRGYWDADRWCCTSCGKKSTIRQVESVLKHEETEVFKLPRYRHDLSRRVAALRRIGWRGRKLVRQGRFYKPTNGWQAYLRLSSPLIARQKAMRLFPDLPESLFTKRIGKSRYAKLRLALKQGTGIRLAEARLVIDWADYRLSRYGEYCRLRYRYRESLRLDLLARLGM